MKQSSINGQIMAGFLLTASCLGLGSTASADVGTCVQSKWNGVINHSMDIQQAFDIPSVTSRAIGPPYKTFDEEMQKRAHLATAHSLKEALEKHLGSLRKLQLKITAEPKEYKDKYRLSGEFVRGYGSGYKVQAWVRKDNCRIIAMVLEASWLKDWLHKTTRFKAFIQENNL